MRAVAVAAVLLFHLDLRVTGGYLGVDVFFVISGLLITGNILREERLGSFRFKRFYLRRIRRLFPALAATLLASLAFGYALFTPDDMARLGRTALFSVLSVSNVLFWKEAGYFDAAAELKPLLHTWSLAVEEQFYLVWPALLVGAWRLGKHRALAAAVGTVLLGSLLAAEALRNVAPGAVFYLTPFRMFELGTGAAIAIWPKTISQARLAQLATVVGLSTLVYAFLSLDSTSTSHHIVGVLPCAGAALVIWGGNNYASRIFLANKLAIAVGAISYSLYLVHWPVIVFYKYTHHAGVSFSSKMLLLAVSIALAIAMYGLVESPFRSPRPNRRSSANPRTAAWVISCLASLVVIVSAHAWYTRGWPFRVPAELRDLPSETALWTERNPVARVGSCFLLETATTLDDARCLSMARDKPNYLIVGDSLAADAYVYLSDAYPGVNFLQATSGNCHPLIENPTEDRVCKQLLDRILQHFVVDTPLDGVVLSAGWQLADADPLEKTVDYLKAHTPRVVVMGSVVRFPANVLPLIMQSKSLRRDDVERFVDGRIHPFEHTLNDILRQRFEHRADAYIDVQAIMCAGHCRLFTPEGKLIYIDFAHLTLSGSRYLAPQIGSTYRDVFPPASRRPNG